MASPDLGSNGGARSLPPESALSPSLHYMGRGWLISQSGIEGPCAEMFST